MKDIDPLFIAVVLLLSIIGIVGIYSATQGTSLVNLYQKQAIFLGIGIIAFLVGFWIPVRMHYVLAYVYYIVIVVILTILVLLPGGVQRWIHLGPLQFQPSEFSKLAALFALSRFLYDNSREPNSLKTILGAAFILLIPFTMVMLQPDLGTAMVFALLYIALLFKAGVKPIYILVIVSPFLSLVSAVHWIPWLVFFAALLAALYLSALELRLFIITAIANLVIGIGTPFFWSKLHPYQQNRIVVFLDPGRDPFGAGYQLIQSKIAIGSGGLWGKGFLKGTQTNLAFLPVRHSDFIFSVLAEQFGLVGTTIILGLYSILLWRILRVAELARNGFYSMVAYGFAVIIFFQVAINIGMTVGMAPITGLPLPFLSSGGTSLVVFMFAMGLVANIRYHRLEY